jgi:hypothetical protein
MPKNTNLLVKSKILKGIRFEQDITLKSYGDAVVKIHPVSDDTLTTIQEKIDYSIFDALEALGKMGLSEEEIEAMVDQTAPLNLDKLSGRRIPLKLSKFMIELCRKGIVPVPDPECPKCHGHPAIGADGEPSICPACDIRQNVEDIRGFATVEIGAAIFGASFGKWQEVEAFFTAKKGLSGPE